MGTSGGSMEITTEVAGLESLAVRSLSRYLATLIMTSFELSTYFWMKG